MFGVYKKLKEKREKLEKVRDNAIKLLNNIEHLLNEIEFSIRSNKGNKMIIENQKIENQNLINPNYEDKNNDVNINHSNISGFMHEIKTQIEKNNEFLEQKYSIRYPLLNVFNSQINTRSKNESIDNWR